MKAYIKNSTAISPQDSFLQNALVEPIQEYSDKLVCIEPVYKEFFPPMKIRRMSRLVKMALTSAKVCLDKAGVEMPEGIITASGWGCLSDTYKYLNEIVDNNIASPSPATFIQSTHNTPGGQIALTLGCQNYNNVIVNGNSSFELALMDALMLLAEGKNNLLVGGFDELAVSDYELKNAANYWKPEGLKSTAFIEHDSEGSLAGEGAAFVLLSNNAEGSHAFIRNCTVLNSLPTAQNVKVEIETLLKSHSLNINDIDVVLSGANGDNKIMPLYRELEDSLFNNCVLLEYKQLCGEYDTSSAFALWLADILIQQQSIPSTVCKKKHTKAINNILIYNYCGTNKHAITLVSKTSL